MRTKYDYPRFLYITSLALFAGALIILLVFL